MTVSGSVVRYVRDTHFRITSISDQVRLSHEAAGCNGWAIQGGIESLLIEGHRRSRRSLDGQQLDQGQQVDGKIFTVDDLSKAAVIREVLT